MRKHLILIACLGSLFLTISTDAQNRLDLGSNTESRNFAKTMSESSKSFGVMAQWQLELAPKEIMEEIVSYRKSVKYCKATITVNEEWFKLTNTDQENFIRVLLNNLHKPVIFQSKTLDYYPNSSGDVSIIVNGKLVATGKYTPTETNFSLVQGTYKEDTVNIKGKYKVRIKVLNTKGRIKFQGDTNIPNSESILLSLRQEGYSGQTQVKVQNGKFISTPFSNLGKPISPGSYSLKLNISNSKSRLMLEGKETFNFPQTQTFVIVLNPTIF
jgi:hypothetical protein